MARLVALMQEKLKLVLEFDSNLEVHMTIMMTTIELCMSVLVCRPCLFV